MCEDYDRHEALKKKAQEREREKENRISTADLLGGATCRRTAAKRFALDRQERLELR